MCYKGQVEWLLQRPPGPTKPKIFTIWPSSEKACPSCDSYCQRLIEHVIKEHWIAKVTRRGVITERKYVLMGKFGAESKFLLALISRHLCFMQCIRSEVVRTCSTLKGVYPIKETSGQTTQDILPSDLRKILL